MATSYSDVIVQNIRATRARKNLDQADVVERMRALGFTTWYRQTMSRTERGERRLAAEEIFGLALALETNMGTLLAAALDDVIELPGGQIRGIDVASLVSKNNGAVRWDGNRPVFGPGAVAWRGERGDDPSRDLV